MCDAKSPIADFYPADFKVDMNGKRNPWEGVNLLPFIDAARMRKTLAALCPPDSLTKEERDRNRFGDPIEYVYDASPAFEGVTFPSCNPGIGLPDLAHCRTRMRSRPDMLYDRTDVHFKAEIKPGCAVPFPGFPSMHVLPIPKAAMAPIKLNCFGSESRYSTFVLNLPEMQPEQLPETSALAALSRVSALRSRPPFRPPLLGFDEPFFAARLLSRRLSACARRSSERLAVESRR